MSNKQYHIIDGLSLHLGWAHRRKVPEAVIMERYATTFAVRRLQAAMGTSPMSADLALPGVSTNGGATSYRLSREQKSGLTRWNASQMEHGCEMLG